jgi:hypothetical protein
MYLMAQMEKRCREVAAADFRLDCFLPTTMITP